MLISFQPKPFLTHSSTLISCTDQTTREHMEHVGCVGQEVLLGQNVAAEAGVLGDAHRVLPSGRLVVDEQKSAEYQ